MPQTLANYEFQTAQRWGDRRLRLSVKLDLFISQTLQKVHLTVSQRVNIAGNFLRDKIVANLSRPVRKIRTRVKTSGGQVKTRTVVDPESRSKPGEFPRADTTRLMKSIYHYHDPHTLTSKVGTDLDYGWVLEHRLDRSFLRRTANAMRQKLLLIVSGGSVSNPVSSPNSGGSP